MTPYQRDILVIFSVSLSTFLGMVAMSGINISLPVIVEEFNTAISHASWIINGYLLVMAGFIVIIGRLADRRGLKRTFLEGILIFTIGSLLCFISWDLNSLIGSRIVQAIGASMFIASGPALIATQVSVRNQGKGQSINTAFSPIGAAVGIGIAGLVTEYVGWRYIFLLSIPLGIVIYLIGRTILTEVRLNTKVSPFDIRGSIMLFLTLVMILAGCTLIYIPSSGTTPIFLFVCSVVTGILFIYHQNKCTESVLNVSLFRNRYFSVAMISSFFIYSLYAGLNYFIPLILVFIYHMSSTDAGLYLMAVGLGSTLFALPAGKIADQYGPRVICIGACCIILPVLYLFTIIPHNITAFILLFFFFRSGFMLYASPSTKQILDQCPYDQKGSGSGIMQTTRYSAYTIGIAILCIVFETVVYNAGVVNDGTAIVNRLTPVIERIGYLSLFYSGIVIALLALIFCIFTRNQIIQSGKDEINVGDHIGSNVDTVY
ncbi:MAG: hypothetical protein CVV33_03630 [Methanomicrobiales archaeon HGW-Methanomicrobiales-4]|nr:MAG: hypothetical protein CVV33_03630 [Methanomicrobiales archaeon HGW-Methanomicrobiales-4]